MWDYHFSDDLKDFNNKLERLNDKIKFIRDEKASGHSMRQAYLNYLGEFHGNHAYRRFYRLAEIYASKLKVNAILLAKGLGGFSWEKYCKPIHKSWTKLLFRLPTTLDDFIKKLQNQ
ncbi:MAG: hypothetical protein ACTSRH_13410 [Promethearchaeota archaeon]